VAGQPHPPAITPGSGIPEMNYPQDLNGAFTTNRIGFNEDINLTRGSHSLQFGGMVERLRYNLYLPVQPFGSWQFGSLQDFLQGIPQSYGGTPAQYASSRFGMRQTFLALYGQDNWQVRPGLTLNLGLRWEPYTVANEVNGLIANQRALMDAAPTLGSPYWKNKSWTNFSPRIGFAWTPLASGKTSIRGGFGLYYVPLDTAIYTTQVNSAYPLNPSIGINNPDPQYFPDALATIAALYTGPGPTSNIDLVGMEYNNSKTPRALQYSLTVQQQFGASNMLAIGYSGRRGNNLTSLGDYNMPNPVWDGVSLALPQDESLYNPLYKRIQYIATNADSWYNGLTASFQRRLSAGLQAQISYTYSSSLDDSSSNDSGNHAGFGGAGAAKIPRDLGVLKSRSVFDFRHTFTASYTYDLPLGHHGSGVADYLLGGWQLSGIVSMQSGQPFWVTAQAPKAVNAYEKTISPNWVSGFDRNQLILGQPDNYYNLDAFSAPGPREFGNLGRNTVTGPGSASWDFGLTKNTALTERVHLQFRAEFFNLLNRANFAAPGQVGTSGGHSFIFDNKGKPVPSLTVINETASPSRQIQMSLKLVF
jgi:hypothetical protein